ncbi:hypothetical protein [Oryzibacter oryziterrae]|uniref:hypothetical protein n=1 Tax=Oryzibacter oryziterrae TaxID=2766474 RepID=UPI001F3A8749|nr:hypothetical protein [Oryzibacter oryziterrae]
MNKIVLSVVALTALAAPSLAFANGVTYWDPSANSSSGEIVTVAPGSNAAAQAEAAKADAGLYTTTVSFYDPSANSSSGDVVSVKVGAGQALVGTHDAVAGSQAAQLDRFLQYRADAQDK